MTEQPIVSERDDKAPGRAATIDLGPKGPVQDPLHSRFAIVNRVNQLRRSRRVQMTVGAIALVALITLPSYVNNEFYLHMCIDVLVYIPLAVGQNLITGNSGQVAMGHAAFYGIGAYAVAILTISHGMGTMLALLIGIVITAVVGLVTGLPAIRISGDYLFIVTIGLNLIFLDVVTQWTSVTGGASGLPGIPVPSVFGISLLSQQRFYYLALVAAVICVAIALLITNSRYGKTLEAVRDDPVAAAASGMSIVRARVAIFAVGAAMAGLSGGILAYQLGFVGPQSFQFLVSLLIFEMAIIGGLGNVFGSILGAVLLIVLPELLRSVQDYRVGIGGLAILVLMVWRPQGLLGTVRMTSLVRR